MVQHPLATLLLDAAAGSYPPADGGWRRVHPWRTGLHAVVAFTGHAVLVVDPAPPDRLLAPTGGFGGVDGFGGAHDPRLITRLAGAGWIDSLDVVLVSHGRAQGPAALVDRPDLRSHPRVAFARAVRDVQRVLGYRDPSRSDVVVLSTGLAGLLELSFELDAYRRGRGLGRLLVEDALAAIPAGTPVLSAVSPGNTASLRALAGAGFRPLASVQLFRPG